MADETDTKTPDPGFRPHSEYAPKFLESLSTATVAVYPSIVRRLDRTAHSFASREQIVASLIGNNMAAAVTATHRIDLGENIQGTQWEMFQNDMNAIAEELKTQHSDADYAMVMEIVVFPDNQGIFGIHVFVLDQQGQNAFSFLLNSHHRSFVDANLRAEDTSEAARARLMERATRLGVAALQGQVAQAQYCATHTEISSSVVHAGVVDDFETGLTSRTDKFGIPMGFVTFGDGSSIVDSSTTTAYPVLPPKVGRNSVLRLDMNVTGWAAFAHIFHDYSVDQWAPYDWSAFDKISFWLFGNNSGASLFVDVLDNRTPCSTVDDAERYVFEFADDFAGWERVTIRFADMVRKEVDNAAPNDGLGLSAVHGWAFGALSTGGPTTFYIDDFELLRTSAKRIDYPINDLPMYGGREKSAHQDRADKEYMKYMTKDGRSRADAAASAARVGWNAFYTGDESTAIKRFNQAWLLDPENQLALWGFAVISSQRGEFEDGARFFRMAIEKGPENPNLRRDYNFTLKQLDKQGSDNPDL
jgi:hypothetical protein